MAATVLGTIAKSGGFGLAFIDDWNVCLAMTAKRRTTETDGGSVM